MESTMRWRKGVVTKNWGRVESNLRQFPINNHQFEIMSSVSEGAVPSLDQVIVLWVTIRFNELKSLPHLSSYRSYNCFHIFCGSSSSWNHALQLLSSLFFSSNQLFLTSSSTSSFLSVCVQTSLPPAGLLSILHHNRSAAVHLPGPDLRHTLR